MMDQFDRAITPFRDPPVFVYDAVDFAIVVLWHSMRGNERVDYKLSDSLRLDIFNDRIADRLNNRDAVARVFGNRKILIASAIEVEPSFKLFALDVIVKHYRRYAPLVLLKAIFKADIPTDRALFNLFAQKIAACRHGDKLCENERCLANTASRRRDRHESAHAMFAIQKGPRRYEVRRPIDKRRGVDSLGFLFLRQRIAAISVAVPVPVPARGALFVPNHSQKRDGLGPVKVLIEHRLIVRLGLGSLAPRSPFGQQSRDIVRVALAGELWHRGSTPPLCLPRQRRRRRRHYDFLEWIWNIALKALGDLAPVRAVVNLDHPWRV